MNKSALVAFFLAFIPGWGHLYLGKKLRFVLYGAGFWFLLILGLAAGFFIYDDWPFIILMLLALVVWAINMLDMVLTLISAQRSSTNTNEENIETSDAQLSKTGQDERLFTIVLSFVPGLGHFQLGLMQRGLTLMIAFFGLATMILFVAVLTSNGGFLVFFGILPIIWIYNLFDVIQQLNRMQRGEDLIDRTIFEDFEEMRQHDRKSKMVATLLAVFPGAGHMYLGLQRRGLQFMAAFLFSIYIMDVMQLSLFLFVIPIVWFYNFFDALQLASKHGLEELKDQPLLTTFVNQRKWLGAGLLVIGAYYLLDRIFIPVFHRFFSPILGIDIYAGYYQHFQTLIVSLVLIAGGIRLLFSQKKGTGTKQ